MRFLTRNDLVVRAFDNGYYVRLTVKKLGADACPGSRAPAGKLEAFVLDQVRSVGRDPKLLKATLAAARKDRIRPSGLKAPSGSP